MFLTSRVKLCSPRIAKQQVPTLSSVLDEQISLRKRRWNVCPCKFSSLWLFIESSTHLHCNKEYNGSIQLRFVMSPEERKLLDSQCHQNVSCSSSVLCIVKSLPKKKKGFSLFSFSPHYIKKKVQRNEEWLFFQSYMIFFYIWLDSSAK